MPDVTVNATSTVRTGELPVDSVSLSPAVPAWNSYTAGGCDSKGRKIALIYSHFASYVIYEAEGALQIEGKTDPLDRSSDVNNWLAEILSNTPQDTRSKRRIFYQLAVALDICMAGNCEGSILILKNISMRAKRLKILKGQLWYLWGCILTASLISSITALIIIMSAGHISLRLLLFMASLGSMGGVLSVAVSLRKIDIDTESGPLFNYSAGAARTIIACIGAIFLHFAVTGNLLFGVVGQNPSSAPLYALAMLAGFSETLVPNSLRRLE